MRFHKPCCLGDRMDDARLVVSQHEGDIGWTVGTIMCLKHVIQDIEVDDARSLYRHFDDCRPCEAPTAEHAKVLCRPYVKAAGRRYPWAGMKTRRQRQGRGLCRPAREYDVLRPCTDSSGDLRPRGLERPAGLAPYGVNGRGIARPERRNHRLAHLRQQGHAGICVEVGALLHYPQSRLKSLKVAEPLVFR